MDCSGCSFMEQSTFGARRQDDQLQISYSLKRSSSQKVVAPKAAYICLFRLQCKFFCVSPVPDECRGDRIERILPTTRVNTWNSFGTEVSLTCWLQCRSPLRAASKPSWRCRHKAHTHTHGCPIEGTSFEKVTDQASPQTLVFAYTLDLQPPLQVLVAALVH
eukprot:5081641-Amphidinium_carterae.1